MKALTKVETLKAAGLWTFLTTVAAYPRLTAWSDRPKALWFLLAILGLSSFVLWSFVYAWLPLRDPQPVVRLRQTAGDWCLVVVGGVAGALLLGAWIDPPLRQITPQDYPDTFFAWCAGSLFTLFFLQLFLCYAPFAFFLRLLSKTRWAIAATLLFGVFVLIRQLQTTQAVSPVSPAFALGLVVARLALGGFALWLLCRGGVVLVWCWVLLLQARLLPTLDCW